MNSPLIVALDLEAKEALKLANKIDPDHCKVKVGSQLFTSQGPIIIKQLNELGFDIFLDLKFHDIPNTVERAVESSIALDLWMLNVHSLGGQEMLKSAIKPIKDSQKDTLLIGVTILTSLDKDLLVQMGFNLTLEDQVMLLAKQCKQQGLDGVVCSPKEILNLRQELGNNFILVTPGIRSNAHINDQKRVSSPKQAIKDGADFIVLGREITLDKNPEYKIKKILETI